MQPAFNAIQLLINTMVINATLVAGAYLQDYSNSLVQASKLKSNCIHPVCSCQVCVGTYSSYTQRCTKIRKTTTDAIFTLRLLLEK